MDEVQLLRISINSSRVRFCGCPVFLCVIWGFNIISLVSSLNWKWVFVNEVIDQATFMLLLKGFVSSRTDHWKYVCSVFLFSISPLFYFHVKTNQGFLPARRGTIKFIHFWSQITRWQYWNWFHLIPRASLSLPLSFSFQFDKPKCSSLQEGTEVASSRS